MEVPFTKMHGCGNDFVVVDATAALKDWQPTGDQAAYLLDRHFGIGGDQLLLLYPSETADARMAIINADGSKGEMCGNGIRCCALYLKERGIVPSDEQVIETLAGLIKPVIEGACVRVDMGVPVLDAQDIPVSGISGRIIDAPSPAVDSSYQLPPMTCVSMGNPHAVFFVDDADAVPLAAVGGKVEILPMFPQRTNVEFATVLNRDRVRMRVWERGSGITLACGTGACGTVVAGILTGRLDETATVILDGGELVIHWAGDGTSVWMTGPAREVFNGTVHLEDA
jgi:diaminopimelate epimerase